ncbi:porin family protein [Flavobacterium pallidum]|uniref:PorT family protein n=1 Tax=Flavobacterium pallidum TaxID=2172098 RepID=A0A2S1SL00_9FLAO|nr:porin family protein [Flavobacterium pallidum]AWI27094.1 PorT family protein [Flavobacterium pallidum]
MKKVILLTMFLILGSVSHAQGVHFGIKGGANFANVDGDLSNSKSITSFHGGIFVELNLTPNFSIQPEALYSSQGAKVEGFDDVNFNYVNIPVMARFYVLPKVLSIDAGPQFGFLVDDDYGNIPGDYKSKSFDFAIGAGATVNIAAGFFASARYNVGLTDASDEPGTEIKNMTAQLSLGYKF